MGKLINRLFRSFTGELIIQEQYKKANFTMSQNSIKLPILLQLEERLEIKIFAKNQEFLLI